MFERRLHVLLLILAVPLLLILGRLAQLQIVEGAHYRHAASRALSLTPRSLPFVRGAILDRKGEVLVRDEPCWDICVDYELIAADVGSDEAAFRRQFKQFERSGRRAGRDPAAFTRAAFRAEIDAMWDALESFERAGAESAGESLRERAASIHRRVSRIRSIVAARRGFDAPVAEEAEPHALLTGLDDQRQIAARETLEQRFPWVHVIPASRRRVVGDGAPLAHLIGRLGRVDADDVERDPNADDPFAKYRADERIGITGVEWLLESELRGRRGQVTFDRDGVRIDEDSFPAENGRDAALTIHAPLQRHLFRLLGDTVESLPESSGGAIVVLDIASRDVLALVSYPSYDPNRFSELYAVLRDDTERFALHFRAVGNRYAPGSILKPLTCLAAMNAGYLDLHTRETCTGYLFPDVRDQWRCWPIHGTQRRQAHGEIDVVGALSGSCNVFMYRLGERLGVGALTRVFGMVGIGRPAGTGLREEVDGINPTPAWLMANKNLSVTPGLARLFAIGQGEISMTPVQVANLMATYANGRFREVSIVRGRPPKAETILPGLARDWSAIRRGIYGVVNDPNGTAYQHARFEHDRYVLCGKTGSATTSGWPVSYAVAFDDADGIEREVMVRAGSLQSAIERFELEPTGITVDPGRVRVATRWPADPPPEGENYAHAWFAGFLQPTSAPGAADWLQPPRLAFAAVVEFGGSGGRVTGPLARRIAEALTSVLGPDLNLDAPHIEALP